MAVKEVMLAKDLIVLLSAVTHDKGIWILLLKVQFKEVANTTLLDNQYLKREITLVSHIDFITNHMCLAKPALVKSPQ